jgi:CheY-like chemotaxis protein
LPRAGAGQKNFALPARLIHTRAHMTKPLALLCYEKLLPGSQLANRLQDTGWRVQTVNDPTALVMAAEEHKPLLALIDLSSTRASMTEQLAALRKNAGTAHIPVIAFSAEESAHPAALAAGATLVVTDTAILQHLAQFLDQALTEF